jgi:hypothetical protein
MPKGMDRAPTPHLAIGRCVQPHRFIRRPGHVDAHPASTTSRDHLSVNLPRGRGVFACGFDLHAVGAAGMRANVLPSAVAPLATAAACF